MWPTFRLLGATWRLCDSIVFRSSDRSALFRDSAARLLARLADVLQEIQFLEFLG